MKTFVSGRLLTDEAKTGRGMSASLVREMKCFEADERQSLWETNRRDALTPGLPWVDLRRDYDPVAPCSSLGPRWGGH